MKQRDLNRLEHELSEFFDEMFIEMGRAERRAAMSAYVTGLLLDGGRKSIEPMAARLVDDASEVQGMRQRLQECVSVSRWSDAELWRRLAVHVQRELPGIEAFVVDDTGFPKKGSHSVGVQRQYSGTLGRIDNCQVATSLHVVSEHASACIGMRLYLPEAWTNDAARRLETGVPEEVAFAEKWRLALEQIDSSLFAGVARHAVLADAGYGDCGEFRAGLTARGLDYVVGVTGTASVWPPSSDPRVRPKSRVGRPPTRHRDNKNPPVAMNVLAKKLDYRTVRWREGTRGWQTSRFAAARVRTAHRHAEGVPPGPELWLLCEWPKNESTPTKHWLASLPERTTLRSIVRLAKLRWRVERDYQDLKEEIGLDHFEGRTWRGFHHHVTLCAVAHAFLALRRALSPPIEHEMDSPGGPTRAAAGPAQENRLLPTVSAAARSRRAASRTVTHLIE